MSLVAPFRPERARPAVALLLFVTLLLPHVASASDDEASAVSSEGISTPSRRFRLRFEVKAGARSSKGEQFKLAFPFPPEFIPAGQDGVYLRTVDRGTSLEVQNVTIRGDGELTPHISARLEIHVLDLYNRNPTSSDDLVAVREAWIRFGNKQELLEEIPGTTFFAQLGKAPRFTKQVDRHLESYGLWGTAVGRFEEIGLEIGGTFGRYVYWRGLLSNGNPLFFRDPNALAGDNGTPERQPGNPDPILESGFPILYDAKAQDLNFDGNFMSGAGVGFRTTTDEAKSGFDALAWYFTRKLEDKARIKGTFYQGDLELLRGAGIPLPVDGDRKTEYGANLAGRIAFKDGDAGRLHLFGQYVSQQIAGLDRSGFELEVAYRIPLNGLFVSGDQPVLNWLEPVVRYSRIDNSFTMPSNFVAPSVGWDWRKIDAGFRLGIVRGVDLTVEYARHDMVTKKKTFHPDEGLLTLRAAF